MDKFKSQCEKTDLILKIELLYYSILVKKMVETILVEIVDSFTYLDF